MRRDFTYMCVWSGFSSGLESPPDFPSDAFVVSAALTTTAALTQQPWGSAADSAREGTGAAVQWKKIVFEKLAFCYKIFSPTDTGECWDRGWVEQIYSLNHM